MRKVIKISGKVVSALLLAVLLVPVAVSVLLDLPVVQNFVVRQLTAVVSERLGAAVHVGRVEIGRFSTVRVSDFYVEDYGRDTLLYAARLEAHLSSLGLFGGGIVLSRARIEDAKLRLRETPEGVMNIKQLVNRISDPDRERKGNFRLRIRSAAIDGMEVRIERQQPRNPVYGVDYGAMSIGDIRANAEELSIEGPTISMRIESLAARERSGFEVKELTGRFLLTTGCIAFSETSVRTARSHFDLPEISLVGGSWTDYRDFVGEVLLHARLRGGYLSTDDIAYFAPSLRRWHTTFRNMDCTVEGTVDDLKVSLAEIEAGEATRLTAEFRASGLPDMKRARFDLDLGRLRTSAGDLGRFAADIGSTRLPAGVLRAADRAGQLGLAGRFEGTFSSFGLEGVLTTEAGNADCRMRVSPDRADRSNVQGSLLVHDVQLGRLSGNPALGRADLSVRVDGTVGHGFSDAEVAGEVRRFEYNGFLYDSLRLDGHLFNREFDGRIVSRNEALDFDFSGLLDLNDSVPRYDFALDLRRADLTAMRINRRDSLSRLSARLIARGSGRSLDDLNGDIRILGASYRYNDSLVHARSIVLRGENSPGSKLVELRSDFVDATFRSRTSYREVFRYLKGAAWRYLPMLAEAAPDTLRPATRAAVPEDFSLLAVKVKNINPLMDAVAQGLQVADGSQLRLLFDPASDRLSLSATSDYVERNRLLATKLNVSASNHRGDSLGVHASSEDFYLGMLHLHDLALAGGAREGRVRMTAGFGDTVERFSGLFGFEAALAPERGADGRVLDVRILPSHLQRDDERWRVAAHRIAVDTAQVRVDRFFVRNGQQSLSVNGVVSHKRSDSLTLRMRNFDLAPLSRLVDRMGYEIGGLTNGTATVKSALRSPELTADIRFDDMTVNHVSVPPLRLVSAWDFECSRAAIYVDDRRSGDTLVRGFFSPSQRRYYARMETDSVDLGLLDPVLKGVVTGTRGCADVRLSLTGQGREAELSGSIRATGLETTVDFTRVSYRVPEVTLSVDGNHLVAERVPFFDPEGNVGLLDVDLDLEHLSNIAYGVRVTPRRMLVLNTTQHDNDTFYGRIYASGTATVTGDKRGVKMDISMTTEEHSSFIMPLSGKSDISNADFVTFAVPQTQETTDLLTRKKQLFERRRQTRTTGHGGMEIALELEVRPDLALELEMAGSTLRGRGEGTLNLEINPQQNLFAMYGDYTIASGSYDLSIQNLISREFLIEEGSTIQWTGSPMNAMIDIDAIYRLKASLAPLLSGTTAAGSDRSVPVECIIHLGDRLLHPEITFEVRVPQTDTETQAVVAEALSTPETTDTQFFYLLVFGSFQSDSDNAGANLGSSSFGTGLEFLSNQLSDLLSIGGYNVNIDYRPRSELTSDELDFGLSKSLVNDRLFVELEGNYVLDNSQAVNRNMSNFMGEAYITWLIDRAGALRLRGFTQTIDRFDENQGLQETGIGIYYKEDFNNFRDLRRRVRERFSGRRRRERRAAEERMREQLDSMLHAGAALPVPDAAAAEPADKGAAKRNRRIAGQERDRIDPEKGSQPHDANRCDRKKRNGPPER